jgi:hypothetical protein
LEPLLSDSLSGLVWWDVSTSCAFAATAQIRCPDKTKATLQIRIVSIRRMFSICEVIGAQG